MMAIGGFTMDNLCSNRLMLTRFPLKMTVNSNATSLISLTCFFDILHFLLNYKSD